MNNKEILQQQQPVIYKTLHNALKKGTLSHCYLFSGEKGTFMKETAILLAQSLICSNKEDEFACEKCTDCLRIEDNNYSDYIYIESDKAIKAADVERIRDLFEMTALEKAGHKVFIVNNCENLTTKSANSLLKSIEEPNGSVTGIFITTQIDRVLPTIVSRCQNLNFKPLSKEAFYIQARTYKMSDLDAHLISYLVTSASEIPKLEKNKNYQKAYMLFAEFTNLLLTDKGMAILYLQKELTKLNKKADSKAGNDGKDDNNEDATNKKDAKLNIKTTFSLFLDISLIFIQDFLSEYHSEDETYTNLLSLAKNTKFNYVLYMRAMIETKDTINMAANILLLADQLLYKLTEV